MMTYFDISITVVIVLNMIAMCIDYYNNPGAVTQFSTTSNIFFTSIFVCEAIIKLIGLGKYYFYNPWNDFDFAVVLFSVAGLLSATASLSYETDDETLVMMYCTCTVLVKYVSIQ